MKPIQSVCIYPWNEASVNPYQKLTEGGFRANDVIVNKLNYKTFLPLSHALKHSQADLLLLDWVHSFYTSKSRWLTFAKMLSGIADQWKMKNRKTPIIWNIHNLHRHDGLHKTAERWSLSRLAGKVDGIRVFNEASVAVVRTYFKVPDAVPIRWIPHGNFISVLDGCIDTGLPRHIDIRKDDFVLLIPGEIREGKGIGSFVSTFAAHFRGETNLKLIIAGRPQSKDLREEILRRANAAPNIFFHPEFMPEEQLSGFFNIADFVVLPYDNILNSGMALMAFSAGRPVIASKAFEGHFPAGICLATDLHNPVSLKKTIHEARLQNPAYLRQQTLEFAGRHSWPDITAGLLSFGNELLRRRP